MNRDVRRLELRKGAVFAWEIDDELVEGMVADELMENGLIRLRNLEPPANADATGWIRADISWLMIHCVNGTGSS
jgi:hypothetical protein